MPADQDLPTKTESEQHLQTRVVQALVAAGVATEDLTIEIECDRVTVRGLVETYEEIGHVGDVLRELPEVREVYEQLTVR